MLRSATRPSVMGLTIGGKREILSVTFSERNDLSLSRDDCPHACVDSALKAQGLCAGHGKADGQLVLLGFDVTVFTPEAYQRRSLQRP